MRPIKFRAWDTEKKKMVYRFFNIDPTSGLCWYENPLKDLPYILMEFTGLLDSKGVEIYEGDIMEWYCCDEHPKRRAVIEISPDRAIKDQFAQSEPARIIGNIYQNPELLTSN